ncbi:hypothetical protein G6F43_000147 [Rhizopus delemar]|nr:hypothetical protein G6F43_000147 [Rhizopus delemar]
MAQKKAINTENRSKQRQGSLPVPIHPDDAKDKVFTAILKALIKMENKPSSPKELANIIVKHKYATLGGATPFATVSSRISQHFKRAAEHNPPRAPLLAKHVDQKHSRKINYSLATESVPTAPHEEEEDNEEEMDLDRKPKKESLSTVTLRKAPRSRSKSQSEVNHEQEEEELSHAAKRRKLDQPTPLHRKSSLVVPGFTKQTSDDDDEEDSEHSDYHEEMLKGTKDELDIPTIRRLPRTGPNITTANAASEEPSKSSLLAAPTQEGINTRKPSFSFNSGFPGEQELWTPFSFEHDFENVLIHDPSTAHHIPFNIATPESISVSELDDYFGNSSNPSNSASKSHRKSFSSTMLGPNDKSLLQKVLLASAARGIAEKIEEQTETDIKKEETEKGSESNVKKEGIDEEIKIEQETQNKKKESSKQTITVTPPENENNANSKPSVNSSNMMNVENSEDFVKFEEDEKKDIPSSLSSMASAHTPILPAPSKKDILPANNTAPSAAAASISELLKSMNIQNINISALQQMTSNLQTLQQLSPTFDLARTMAAYMQSLSKPATTTAAATTTHINNNTSTSTSSSSTSSTTQPPSIDIKSILARFPVLEAFLRKDNNKTVPSNPISSPLASPTTDTIPNLVNVNSADPIVNTLTPMTPAMYITVIDHIAVCVIVLEKTETTPEYRIMRRLDTGFINGTTLLAAGGIETESERSMILSFEMDRVRMPKKKSQLFGTWIPLRRAQELAITCSVQHKLGHFLDDSIESYFPSPLPIQIAARKPPATRDNRLTALALAALRSEKGGFVVPPISRSSSSSGAMAATQLQELLLTHPHKALKSSDAMLGQSDDRTKSSQKEESDDANQSDSSSLHEDESDTEVKNGILTGSALQELFTRASLAHPTHIHPKDLQKKRRHSSLPEMPDDSLEDEAEVESKVTQKHARKRSGGKWSTASNNSSSGNGDGGKLASYGIKKSASTGGSTISRRTPAGGKRAQQKKMKGEPEEMEEEVKNMVVEHKSNSSQPVDPVSISQSEENNDLETVDIDEDEDIDIGGSDFDDDLR